MNIQEIKREYNKYKTEIKRKLKEFSKLPKEKHIYELFFCLLTPQSKAEKCWLAVEQLKKCALEKGRIENCLKSKTRFYKNKTRYIIEATKKWLLINRLINSRKSPLEIRRLLTNKDSEYKIKGLGMKEASHFLRNIGKSRNQLAILDRHILKNLLELGIINNIKVKNNKDYLEKEQKLKKFSRKAKISLNALDLLFWKIGTGRIFK